MKKILFFTYCDQSYFHYAALYPLFALANNEDSIVEIGLNDLIGFSNRYSEILAFYEKHFPKRVRYVEHKLLPGYCVESLRFIYTPSFVAEYIYIGDVDILILDRDVCQQHTNNIEKNNLDFSNVVRLGSDPLQLTGLHFIKYNDMYPLKDIDESAKIINDEAYLYSLMREKELKIPDEDVRFRPLHGIHCTPNRPFKKMPLSGKEYSPLKWGVGGSYQAFVDFSASDYYKDFLEILNPDAKKHLKIIQLLQLVELTCFYTAIESDHSL